MPKRAHFRFYEELNDFLPKALRYTTIERTFELSPSVKDMIEALGVDANLGRLARYLRLLGFDADYDPDLSDPQLAERSQAEGRLLLTRDVDLLKRRTVTHGYYVRATDPQVQAGEVMSRFDLAGSARPFTRCTSCNSLLVPVDKGKVAGRVPPPSLERFDEFHECPGCRQVYWEGSHMQRANRLVAEILGTTKN